MPDDLHIMSLRGGLNNTDPPSAIADDQCTEAENVETYYSMLGERRKGCAPITLSADLLATSVIVHLSQWLPTNSAIIPEWFVIGAIPGTSATIAKRIFSTWTTISPKDAVTPSIPDIFHITSQAMGSLFFFAYKSAQDRLHVWDGTNFRRTGLAAPVAPTFANHGSGSYASTRYARVRYIERNVASLVLRRSEPSPSLVIAPSGSGDGVTITMPALIAEGETHWELEMSEDNATFYPISTQAVASTTYLDTATFAAGYAGINNGLVSEEIGSYTLQPSAKYMITDGDRLIFAGHQSDPTRQSTVWFTPVAADPGAGNSERLRLAVNNSRNLDGYEGGGITGLSSSVYGTWYAFKWSHIYLGNRTEDDINPYKVTTLTKKRGAISGSVVTGADRAGDVCTYFIDPSLGPSRIGSGGIQVITGIDRTWRRINLLADVPCVGVYYSDHKQIWWWIAIDGSTYPNYILKLQVSETVSAAGVVSRGWAVATGLITRAYCAAILSEQSFEGGFQTLSNRPCIGMASPHFVQRCDTGTTDNGVPYVAAFITKPFMLAGLANQWGARVAAILVSAVSNAYVRVRLIKDFGKEGSVPTVVDCTPEATGQTHVVKILDDLVLNEAATIQVEVSDYV